MLLRKRYWVLKGRQAVRRVCKSCITCKRLQEACYPTVPSPDLPQTRVSEDPPFAHTGVDFAGPLFTFNEEGTSQKVYVCLFTCASTRAVHLELVRDMGVDTFLLAVRQFVSRRGLHS